MRIHVLVFPAAGVGLEVQERVLIRPARNLRSARKAPASSDARKLEENMAPREQLRFGVPYGTNAFAIHPSMIQQDGRMRANLSKKSASQLAGNYKD